MARRCCDRVPRGLVGRTWRWMSSSSAAWLRRQQRDPYVAAARAHGWASRASFKLLQLHESHGVIQRGDVVVDLGAAPGGWSLVSGALCRGEALDGVSSPSANNTSKARIEPKYTSRGGTGAKARPRVGRFGSSDASQSPPVTVEHKSVSRGSQSTRDGGDGEGRRESPHFVCSVDLLQPSPEVEAQVGRDPRWLWLTGDFEDARVQQRVQACLMQSTGRRVADVVLSDMAPSFAGQADRDHDRSVALAMSALQWATQGVPQQQPQPQQQQPPPPPPPPQHSQSRVNTPMLRVGGTFVCKVNRGGSEGQVMQTAQRHFERVQWVKPHASRQRSREIFLLCKGFIGGERS